MCSRKLLRENDNVMRPNYRSVTMFCTASVNNVMTFSAYKSDRNIFYKQFNFGLAPRTLGLVTSSNSLPEGQPHLFIFISPCRAMFKFYNDKNGRENLKPSPTLESPKPKNNVDQQGHDCAQPHTYCTSLLFPMFQEEVFLPLLVL